MKKVLLALALVAGLCMWSVGTSIAQEGKKDAPKHGDQPKPPVEKKPEGEKKPGDMKDMQMDMADMTVTPSAEHKRLEAAVGTWKHETSWWMEKDGPEIKSTGTEVVKPVLGGLAFTCDYESIPATGKGKFLGHGMITWNMTKQQYQHTWIDNMSHNGAETSWGTFDEKSNSYTFTGDFLCPEDGKVKPIRMVDKWDGKDKHTFEMFAPGKDGKEFKAMQIVYTRQK